MKPWNPTFNRDAIVSINQFNVTQTSDINWSKRFIFGSVASRPWPSAMQQIHIDTNVNNVILSNLELGFDFLYRTANAECVRLAFVCFYLCGTQKSIYFALLIGFSTFFFYAVYQQRLNSQYALHIYIGPDAQRSSMMCLQSSAILIARVFFLFIFHGDNDNISNLIFIFSVFSGIIFTIYILLDCCLFV